MTWAAKQRRGVPPPPPQRPAHRAHHRGGGGPLLGHPRPPPPSVLSLITPPVAFGASRSATAPKGASREARAAGPCPPRDMGAELHDRTVSRKAWHGVCVGGGDTGRSS